MRDVEIPNWLKRLPLAPEFHPTDTEFADPIAYISKIEKEAGAFGICKVIPPLPKPSKKYVLSNLNKSLLKCPELGSDVNLPDVGSSSKLDDGDKGNDGEVRAVFTTRHQELGQSMKSIKAPLQPQPSTVHKQVWQSGEIYTLEQFESKSKAFARSQLGMFKEVSPLVIEALFWKATSEKPIYVEYANDVPGSGFGEPEGPFLYFHRRGRRRRGAFDRNNRASSDSKKHQTQGDTMGNNSVDQNISIKNDPNSFLETSKTSTCLPFRLPDQTSRSSRQMGSNAGHEMECTAGWKLSNSPWNLQVIARSPGSLTRFMPDDIPGVTSPMVYIGMLFSWFAWHVEDHELHSLNFLHTGSSKTWYAVPGDYAFTFEEVIRTQAYGGNIDRLAALTLLGEKTTLLSPEIVVASDIPCCRLVQNPGEFVVTFPRAYHVGFSHGFNCGEAANFGTPKWLTVAKEAAVRRAAMNYLPMLSHQQLLYLLTMSFVSRVPRSLLPGARSSRLRDRQKEERELLVKKAFIEDILNENHMLTILQKNSSYHAVLWDVNSLRSSSKESELCSSITTVATSIRENVSSENDRNQDLFSQMSLYMENMNDLYVDADDLSCDLQVDSGTLPCVACGILGFPFMSVVQPSEQASIHFLPPDNCMVQDLGVFEPVESNSPSDLSTMAECSIQGLDNQNKTLNCNMSLACKSHITATTPRSGMEFKVAKDGEKSSMDASSFSPETARKMKLNEDSLIDLPNGSSSSAGSMPTSARLLVPCHFPSPKDLLVSSECKFEKGLNTSNGFLRPHIFCLEHALQVEKLLHSKGGANVLVICHSDFQKIEVHAAAIAEEIGSSFNYKEIPLDNASQEDLNLINLAIDDEEQDECGEDWTSKLSVSLRHCMKARKSFPCKKVQHALTLDGLFFDTTANSKALSPEWQSRKSRSRRNLNYSVHSKPPETIQIKKDEDGKPSETIRIEKGEDLGAKLGGRTSGKEGKLLQYSRRSSKSEACGSAAGSKTSGDPNRLRPEVSVAGCEDPDGNSRNSSVKNVCKTEKTENNCSEPGARGKPELQHGNQVFITTDGLGDISVPSQVADSLTTATSVVENVETQIGNYYLKEMVMEDKAADSTQDDSHMQHVIKVDESNEKNERSYFGESAGLSEVAFECTKKIIIERENQIIEELSMTNKACSFMIAENSGGQRNNQDDEVVLITMVSDPANLGTSADDSAVSNFDQQMEKTVVDQICLDNEVSDCVTLDNEVQQEIRTSNENKPIPGNVTLSTALSLEECLEVPSGAHAAVELQTDSENCSLPPDKSDLDNSKSTIVCPKSVVSNGSKRKREVELEKADQFFNGFIRSPCEGLRSRVGKDATRSDINEQVDEKQTMKKVRKHSDGSVLRKGKKENKKGGSYRCDLEGCRMSFQTKEALVLHKRNMCPHEGCGKIFSSHKYAMLHQRVHDDDRPLKCPWKGCTMSFKWAWARTEHLRVHTGERPYECKIEGCGLTFRFVSDFSRHRRKTGHYVKLQT